MRAARLHKIGQPLVVEDIHPPLYGSKDVLVQVEACRIPNLQYTVENIPRIYPGAVLPTLPAVFGFDVVGRVVARGQDVTSPETGTRVYVSSGLACGTCPICRKGEPVNCPDFCFPGFFGMSPGSQGMIDRYQGGMAELMPTPAYNAFPVPDSMTAGQVVRLDYLATTYSAMRKAGVGPGSTILINGASGTLGTCALVLSLAMGVSRVVLAARKKEVLDSLAVIDPSRIVIHHTGGDGALRETALAATEGIGCDAVIDCLGPAADASASVAALDALRRGGRLVLAGGVARDLPVHSRRLQFNQHSILGSLLFTPAELSEVISMIGAGLVDLSMFPTEAFKLDRVNQGLQAVKERPSGLTNYILVP